MKTAGFPWRRASSVGAWIVLLTTALPAPRAFAQAPDAKATDPKPAEAAKPVDPNKAAADSKANLAAGDKAARAKDWLTAQRAYEASLAALRTPKALLGLANAHYKQANVAEAYDAYDDLLKTYDTQLRGADKAMARNRLKELGRVTGGLPLRVSEAGATVTIDGKLIGTTPLPAVIRVKAGTHLVRLEKEGFQAVERSVEVPAGGVAVAEVIELVADAKTGRLVVREKHGKPLRVLVDGVDVGPTPYEGDLEPGTRQVGGRGSGLAAPPASVEVARGKRVEVELEATAVFGRLEVKTSDGAGVIVLDGKVVGEGNYQGEVTVGPHELVVRREGFLPFQKKFDVADRQTIVESVTLRREGASGDAADVEDASSSDGLYGGVQVGALFGMAPANNSLDTNCTGLGATSCNATKPLGGALHGTLGYSFHPLALELLFGGAADVNQPSATYDGVTGANVNPSVASPARVESFTIVRGGGDVALRARFSHDFGVFRLTAAAGGGLAVRYMRLSRSTRTTDGTERTGTFFGSDAVYVSPAVTAQAGVGFRLSSTLRLMMGAELWADNAGESATTDPSSAAVLTGGTGAPAPQATPAYDMARGYQLFVGPYLGLQFGP